jgi:hypothetical protein
MGYVGQPNLAAMQGLQKRIRTQQQDGGFHGVDFKN